MKQGNKKPKYQIGDEVYANGQLLHIGPNSPQWNGLTFMYEFEGSDMRCGEMYLSRPTPSTTSEERGQDREPAQKPDIRETLSDAYHNAEYLEAGKEAEPEAIGLHTFGELHLSSKAKGDEYSVYILSDNNHPLAIAQYSVYFDIDTAEANAAHIVRCWNAYPALVKENEALVKGWKQDKDALLDALKENQQLKRLLHDLTPGGSEFYNDPEYCAKWIRESRQEAHYSMAEIIKKEKEKNQQQAKDIQDLKNVLRMVTDRLESLDETQLFNEIDRAVIKKATELLNRIR